MPRQASSFAMAMALSLVCPAALLSAAIRVGLWSGEKQAEITLPGPAKSKLGS